MNRFQYEEFALKTAHIHVSKVNLRHPIAMDQRCGIASLAMMTGLVNVEIAALVCKCGQKHCHARRMARMCCCCC